VAAFEILAAAPNDRDWGALQPGWSMSAERRVLAQADVPAPHDERPMLVGSRHETTPMGLNWNQRKLRGLPKALGIVSPTA
jgi:hypothetical protein